MKQTKTIIKILIVFLLITQNSFALSTPIPGVGIVVKKNPGGANITVPTGNGGGFSIKLEEGVYELSFPQDQLQTSINGIIKTNYPKSSYQYDGSGVEFVLDNSLIKVNSNGLEGNRFAVDKQNSITITVPKGGATLSGKLSWDDAVMTNSKICPEGFTMQNGECVPINSGNQQSRTEGKTKGKVKDLGPKSPMITVGNSNNSPSLNASLNANGGTSASTGVSNSFSFNPSLGLELQWNHFGIGFDAGTFNTKPNFDFDTYAAPLQNLDYLTITNTKNNYTSTYFLLGPQYTVSLGGCSTPLHNKLTFTVALKGGLTFNKTPDFSITDNSTPPKNVASYEAPQDYKKNAFSLKPSISFTYWISKSIALTANAQYLMQTGQEEFTTAYRDLSAVNFNLNPQEVKSQILAAPKVVSTTKGPDKYVSFGFGITYSFNNRGGRCANGSCSSGVQKKGIQQNGLKKNDAATTNDTTQRKGIKEQGLKKNEVETLKTVPTGSTDNQNQRPCDCCHEIHGKGLCPKGCDMATSANVVNVKDLEVADSVKNSGNAVGSSGVKVVAETSLTGNTTNQKQIPCKCCQGFHSGKCPKGCDIATSASVVNVKDLEVADSVKNPGNAVGSSGVKVVAETTLTGNTANQKQIPCKCCQGFHSGRKCPKGCDMATSANLIDTKDLYFNESGKEVKNQADVKAISELLVNYRKGWDGSIKGNIAAKKGINEKGLKQNEAKSENINLNITSTAQKLVNLARKGWDGSIKGNKIESVANEADVKSIAETLVNIRKGWDGSIKGNKAKNIANEADVKMIAEALVNLRKGWDGSIKGGKN